MSLALCLRWDVRRVGDVPCSRLYPDSTLNSFRSPSPQPRNTVNPREPTNNALSVPRSQHQPSPLPLLLRDPPPLLRLRVLVLQGDVVAPAVAADGDLRYQQEPDGQRQVVRPLVVEDPRDEGSGSHVLPWRVLVVLGFSWRLGLMVLVDAVVVFDGAMEWLMGVKGFWRV